MTKEVAEQGPSGAGGTLLLGFSDELRHCSQHDKDVILKTDMECILYSCSCRVQPSTVETAG